MRWVFSKRAWRVHERHKSTPNPRCCQYGRWVDFLISKILRKILNMYLSYVQRACPNSKWLLSNPLPKSRVCIYPLTWLCYFNNYDPGQQSCMPIVAPSVCATALKAGPSTPHAESGLRASPVPANRKVVRVWVVGPTTQKFGFAVGPFCVCQS